jgi:prolipoprotein diacylglyceryl transferase
VFDQYRQKFFYFGLYMIYSAYIVVDPDRTFFVVPYIHHPITWYGLLFALGFFIAYFIVRKMFEKHVGHDPLYRGKEKNISLYLTDRLATILVIATVIGARLGHVFFYDWPIYKAHPIDILKVWEGGLASHGAAVGILLGLAIFTILYRRKYKIVTFLATLDSVVVAAAFAGGCIRIGNFVNQEILGRPTDLPWGVLFLHPLEGPNDRAVHPVQLYESVFYFLVFGLLWILWKKTGEKIGQGLLTGLFLLLVFSFRFLVEFFKFPLGGDSMFFGDVLSMGQLLSIPFIILGLYFMIRPHRGM